VLIQNPEIWSFPPIPGLIRTSWDEKSYWMIEEFSFTRVFEAFKNLELSPFMMIDARLSFLLKLLNPGLVTRFKGVPPLASINYALSSKLAFECDSDFVKYWKEYCDDPIPQYQLASYSQLVSLNKIEASDLERLEKAGTVFVASFEKRPEMIPGFKVADEWSFEEDSELGLFFVVRFSK
jgi:hypothetical protein